MEYRIKFEDEVGQIIDDEGQPVSAATAYLLIKRLAQSYPVKCWVYIGRRPTNGQWKIGMSRNVARRAEQLKIDVKHIIECGNVEEALLIESLLHGICRNRRVTGEWYKLTKKYINAVTCYDNAGQFLMATRINNAVIFGSGEIDVTSITEFVETDRRINVVNFGQLYCDYMQAWLQSDDWVE